jgi:DNA anti-recombination protein RmuC
VTALERMRCSGTRIALGRVGADAARPPGKEQEAMTRTRKTTAGVLGALLVTGACSLAAAQSTKNMTQEQFDREKTTLKDRAQESITSANANIDALKKMSDMDKGTAKKRDDDMQKKLSDQRDHLTADIDKMDQASIADWSGMRPIIQRDLTAMDTQLKAATKITHVPPSGATNKQP